MTKNKFKLLFSRNNKNIDVDYFLHDSELARKWFSKLKKIHKIPYDLNESKLNTHLKVEEAYKKICKTFNFDIDQSIDFYQQKNLNLLHQLYETIHNTVRNTENFEILYEFHHAVHQRQKEINNFSIARTYIGWGVKEGPLEEKYNCHKYYETKIKNLHIYLPWSELGKKPYHYWESDEPHDLQRFNELCVCHKTLRCQFFIATSDYNPTPFPKEFNTWFDQYKQSWLESQAIYKWDHIDEFSAPLLAEPLQQFDLKGFTLKQIII